MKTPHSVMPNRLRKLRWPAVAASTAFILGMGAGAGWSVWSNEATTGSLNAATGSLDIAANPSNAYWRRSTAGFPNPQPCGPLPADLLTTPDNCPNPTDPSTLVLMPGDTVDFVIPVSTTVAGNNLAAGFSVQITDQNLQDAVDGGFLAIEYYVATPNSAGPFETQIAPATGYAPIVNPETKQPNVLALPGTVPGSSPTTNNYVVVAHLTVLGDYVWNDDFSGPYSTSTLSAEGVLPEGAINFDLIQLRAVPVVSEGGN